MMNDSRYINLAKLLLSYSVRAKQGDKIWVRCLGLPALTLAREVFQEAIKMGAYPYLDIGDDSILPAYFSHAVDHQLSKSPDIDEFIVTWADKIVTIVGEENTRLLVDVDPEKFVAYQKTKKKIRQVTMTKPWVLTWVPSNGLAQDAGMSFSEFEDFYFKATLLDWEKEGKRFTSLGKRLSNAKKIEVIGKDTHLTLSAEGRLFIPDNGECNMPGGEVFTAPVDTSVEGHIYFEFPLLRSGKLIKDIRFWFEHGRIVRATASENQDLLLKMLDTDSGARTLGEFAIGMNPGIRRYMYNTLFDEKIEGTIHLAFGEAYEECGGVNKSAMHVDIVKDMRSPGSQLIIDGELILEEGKLLD